MLRLVDIAPLTAGPAEEAIQASVTDLDAMTKACAGAASVIHLAGVPGEGPWEQVVARQHPRHLRGLRGGPPGRGQPGHLRLVQPRGRVHAARRRSRSPTTRSPRRTPTTASPRWPGEALAALYHYRYGLDTICLRILTCCDRPTYGRALSTWLSPGDCGRLFEACLTAPDPGYRVAFGVSANTRGGWVSLAEARALGYEPRDDAEVYAAEVIAATGEPDPDDPVWPTWAASSACPPSTRTGSHEPPPPARA